MPNPHFLNPVCITGMDFSVFIVTYQAEEMVDVPRTINFKNHDGLGSMGRVTINQVDPIHGTDSDSSNDGDSDSSDDGSAVTRITPSRNFWAPWDISTQATSPCWVRAPL